MANLRPCTGCQRHVRAHETRCPFCDVELEAFTPVLRGSNVPLTRAAILFASATAVAACTGGSDPGPSSSSSSGSSGASSSGNGVPLYGVPEIDAGDDGGDNTKDSGGPVALYGPAPVQDGG